MAAAQVEDPSNDAALGSEAAERGAAAAAAAATALGQLAAALASQVGPLLNAHRLGSARPVVGGISKICPRLSAQGRACCACQPVHHTLTQTSRLRPGAWPSGNLSSPLSSLCERSSSPATRAAQTQLPPLWPRPLPSDAALSRLMPH